MKMQNMHAVYILYIFNIFFILHIFDIFKSFIYLMWFEDAMHVSITSVRLKWCQVQ